MNYAEHKKKDPRRIQHTMTGLFLMRCERWVSFTTTRDIFSLELKNIYEFL